MNSTIVFLRFTACFLIVIAYQLFGVAQVSPKPISKEYTVPIPRQYTIKWNSTCDRQVLEVYPEIAVLYSYEEYMIIQLDAYHDIHKLPFKACIESMDTSARVLRTESYLPFFDPGVNRLHFIQEKESIAPAIGLKEEIPDSTDVDIYGKITLTNSKKQQVVQHSTDMATIIAGTGNTLENSKGVLPKGKILSFDFRNILPEDPELLRSNDIHVINHSYGLGIEDFYGLEAEAYDAHAFDHNDVLSVFSAGNSGTGKGNTSTYQLLEGRANLTGNFKYAKNVLTMGAVDSFANRLSISSVGPSPDGRIKPELVAFGLDGTSGASAIASGLSAGIFDMLYAEDFTPTNFLVRSILLAGSDDIGLPGPDHKTGYGLINAKKSVDITENGHFRLISDVVGTYVQEIDIQNISDFKIVVSWNDVPGIQLINDLDLKVIGPDGSIHYPWVLKKEADEVLLSQPARKAEDHTNNNEVIDILLAQPGKYIVEVKKNGASVMPFAIAWHIQESNAFSWTWPYGKAPILKGENILRYDKGSASYPTIMAEYMDGQMSVLESDSSQSFVLFEAPKVGDAVRFLAISELDTFFSQWTLVSDRPELQLSSRCIDQLIFTYESEELADSVSLRVWRNGKEDVFRQALTQDRSIIFNGFFDASSYFSVQTQTEGFASLRSVLRPLSNFFAQCLVTSYDGKIDGDKINLRLKLGTYAGVSSIKVRRKTVEGDQAIFSINAPQLLDFSIEDIPVIGYNEYFLEILGFDGRVLYEQSLEFFFVPPASFLISPNVVSSGEEIYFNQNQFKPAKILVYTPTGAIVLEEELLSISEYIDTYQLSKGLYFYRITSIDLKEQFGAGSFLIR
ncbi:MAG: S8 family peptidase [Saprospiraceae bacterium]|nr:S8 family peptidase [Saprospiraceae bacterium]